MSSDTDMVENAARAIRNRAEQPIDMAEARYLAWAALDASGIGELVETLRGATRGLHSEDATNYIPRGVSAQACLEAAERIEALHAEREKLGGLLRAAQRYVDENEGDWDGDLGRRISAALRNPEADEDRAG